MDGAGGGWDGMEWIVQISECTCVNMLIHMPSVSCLHIKQAVS